MMSLTAAPSQSLPHWGTRIEFASFLVERVPAGPRSFNIQLPAATFASINFAPGSGRSSLAGDRLRPFDRMPFEYLVVPPGFPLKGEEAEAPEVLAFVIDFDAFRPILAAAYAVPPERLQPQVIMGTPCPFTTELAKKIRFQLGLEDPSRPYLESLCTAMLGEMFRPCSQPAVERTSRRLDQATMGMLLKYIDANLDADLSVATLSGLAGVSSHHLSRTFRQKVGEALHSYILSRRTDAARSLLSGSDLALAQIAVKTGFSSQSHMTSVFRKVLGATPGQLRRGGEAHGSDMPTI